MLIFININAYPYCIQKGYGPIAQEQIAKRQIALEKAPGGTDRPGIYRSGTNRPLEQIAH